MKICAQGIEEGSHVKCSIFPFQEINYFVNTCATVLETPPTNLK